MSGVHADHRLEPVRVFAAKIIQETMLGTHELDVDLSALVPARSARIDEQLHVNALFVHVADASVHVPVVTVQARILTAHEFAIGPACGGAGLCLAQCAWDVSAPAADGVSAPE